MSATTLPTGLCARLAPAAVAAALAAASAPASAEIDPPRVVRGPDDGVWIQLTAVLPTGDGDVAVQLGRLGGTDISYAAVQGERRLGGGFAAGVAYGYGQLGLDRAPDLGLHLVRLSGSWTNGGRRVELDARLWAEALIPERGDAREQVRGRLRATFALPGVQSRLAPRLFVADEVFVERREGLTRNRISAGVRTRPGRGLSLDVAYQLSADTGGGGRQNVLLVQLTRVLGRRS